MKQSLDSPSGGADRGQRWLFVTTALLEASAGLGLLGLPGLAVALLFGIEAPSPEALVVARIAGAALLAIGLACWIARDDHGSRARYGLLLGMLLYNVGACGVLSFAGAALRMAGFALGPVALLHALMALWCAVSVHATRAKAR